MVDPALLVTLASTGTLAVALSAAALLKAWQGWLDVKRMELNGTPRRRRPPVRLELTDLRDRVRRLERIASGAES